MQISFRFDKSGIELEYKDNRQVITRLDSLIRAIDPETLDSILVITQSSPEGIHEHNLELSRKRAARTVRFLRDLYPELKDKIRAEPQGEAWKALKARILQDKKLTADQKIRVVGIIDADINPGTKKWRMERLPYYHEIYGRHYHPLRRSAICVIHYKDDERHAIMPPAALDQLLEEAFVDDELEEETILFTADSIPSPIIPLYRYPVFAFRTNLLVPAFNIGIEVPIGKHWSAGADYYYPWILAKNNRHCVEMLGIFLDGKYWFGKERTLKERLTGHAIGLYGGAGYYDFQHLKSGYQGEFIDIGIDYTYAVPIAKDKLRMAFNIGLGYIYTQARHYTPTDDYSDLIRDPGIRFQKFNFFGPTRASISFIIPIRAKLGAKGGRS